MKSKKSSVPRTQHAFFRTMVLMGGSLAVGCGGATTDDSSTDAAQTGSGGDSGLGAEDSGLSGGAFGVGGSSGAGGTFATGGTMTTGGTAGINGASGGITSDGGASMGTGGVSMPSIDSVAPDPSCPPTQWSCWDSTSIREQQCNEPYGYYVPHGCVCDSSRPRSIDDCGMNETFVCLKGGYTSDGTPLSESVPFECSCIPRQSYCQSACDLVWPITGGGLFCDNPDAGTDSVLCGCAFIYLL